MTRNHIAAIALSVAAVSTIPSAWAQDTNSAAAPYFRSFSGLSFDIEGTGGYSSGTLGITDYKDSNIAPASTYASGSGNENGSLVNATTWSQYNGFFSARNYAAMNVANVQNEGYYVVAGQGSHTQVRFFTPEAQAVRSVFTWHVTGSAGTNAGAAFGRLDFLAGQYPSIDYNDWFGNTKTMTTYGAGNYSYNLPLILDQPIDLYYWSAAAVEVTKAQAAQILGGNINGVANYGNTYELAKIDLYDASDSRITNWTMQDTSTGLTVFNQDGRTAAANIVPEPGTAALVVIAGFALLPLRRRKNKALSV